MRRLALVVVGLVVVLASCALRPRYGDFITAKTTEKMVTFVVVDADTNQPVPGAKVEWSELKNRMVATTGPEGRFEVPVDKKYVAEDPVFVVTLPATSTHYRLELAPAPAPNEDVPVAQPAGDAPPPAADAGLPLSDPLRTNG